MSRSVKGKGVAHSGRFYDILTERVIYIEGNGVGVLTFTISRPLTTYKTNNYIGFISPEIRI